MAVVIFVVVTLSAEKMATGKSWLLIKEGKRNKKSFIDLHEKSPFWEYNVLYRTEKVMENKRRHEN